MADGTVMLVSGVVALVLTLPIVILVLMRKGSKGKGIVEKCKRNGWVVTAHLVGYTADYRTRYGNEDANGIRMDYEESNGYCCVYEYTVSGVTYKRVVNYRVPLDKIPKDVTLYYRNCNPRRVIGSQYEVLGAMWYVLCVLPLVLWTFLNAVFMSLCGIS